MPRTRRPFSGQDVITQAHDEFHSETGGPVGVREAGRWEASRHWFPHPRNRSNDPLTYMFVIDTLLLIDDQVELRAVNLRDWMAIRYPMYFDPITLGRILSDLSDTVSLLGERSAFLQPGRDWRGNFYLLNWTAESVALLRALRNQLMRLTEVELAEIAAGRTPDRSSSPLLECRAARGETDESA